jgi:lysozyme family protein
MIGPKTILATRSYLGNKITDKRLGFLKGLSTWATFGRGWSNRINDVYAVVRDLCSR